MLPNKLKKPIKIVTNDGAPGKIIGTDFCGWPLIRLDAWTDKDIQKMGGEEEAWIWLSDSQYKIVEG